MSTKRVVVYTIDFDPDENSPKPCSFEIQFHKLEEYCSFNGLSLNYFPQFMGNRFEYQTTALMEQPKIKEMLSWFDENNGKVDALLIYSEKHLSKDKNRVREFKKELANMGIELIFATGNTKEKEFSPQHQEIMLKAFPEIATIYRAIQCGGITGKKTKNLKDSALNRFKIKPGEFSYIKREYLERDPLYKHLKAKQRARFFFGKIIQYVFRDKNLTVLNKEIIIEELRKTEGWKEFRGY